MDLLLQFDGFPSHIGDLVESVSHDSDEHIQEHDVDQESRD